MNGVKKNSLPWALVFLLVLAFALRIARLDFQHLWWDEGWSVYFATSDIPTMIARTAIDIHPPFYYLLLHLWVLIAGPSPFSLRLLSATAGLLAVLLVFHLGKRFFDLKVGYIAAFLLAIAPFPIYYSQEARMYSMVLLLGLVSTYLAVRLWEKQSPALWSFYLVVTISALYTQYYATFIPLAQTIFAIIAHRDRIRRWLLFQAALFLLYLPWFVYAGAKLVDYVGTKLVKEADVPRGFLQYMAQHLAVFGMGHLSAGMEPLAWLSLMPMGLAILGVAYYHKAHGRGILLSLLYLLVPLAMGFLINLRFPFTALNIERLLLLASPPFYLLTALGVYAFLERRRLFYLSLLTLLALSTVSLYGFYTVKRYPEDDYRPLIRRLQGLASPQDVIVTIHPWQVGYLKSYYQARTPSVYLTPKEKADVTRETWAEDPELMHQELDDLLQEHPRLWLPSHQALGRILESEIEEYLNAHYYSALNEWYGENTKLLAYIVGDDLAYQVEPHDFGDQIRLVSYGLSAKPVEAAWGVIGVELLWERIGEVSGDLRIALRLEDDLGYSWASQDAKPLAGQVDFSQLRLGERLLDRHGLMVSAGTPPGTYHLRLLLYDARNIGAPPLGVLTLGEVEVTNPSLQPSILSLPIQRSLEANFAGDLQFLGHTIEGGPYKAGYQVELSLFWRALAKMGDYRIRISLVDKGGRITLSEERAFAYPTSNWPVGGQLRDPQSFLIPANTSPGQYQIYLSVLSPDGELTSTGWWPFASSRLKLASIRVEGRAHTMEPPAKIEHALRARLGEGLLLLGYDLNTEEVRPGGNLELVLYWRAISSMNTSYTVFSHLINAQNEIWGQVDAIPGDWTLPTTSWVEGEYITDHYAIPVKEDTPPGDYLLEVGMYDATTMMRLQIYDESGSPTGDRVLLELTPIRILP